jgi:hypothetical protein
MRGRDGLAFEGRDAGEDLLLRAGLAAFDADLAEDSGRGKTALVACGQIGGPVLGVEGIGKQSSAVGFGGQVPLA